MRSGIAEELQRKQQRRRIEYLIVLSALSVIVGYHGAEFRLQTMIGLALSCLGVSWTLTQYRLQRRTLPSVSATRALMDSIEKLGMCVLVIVFLLSVLIMPEQRSHLTYSVVVCALCLVFGTFSTEEIWIQRFFSGLSQAQQLNFLQHFHASMLRVDRGQRVNGILKWNSLLG
jgi:hypothetical protein